MSSDSASRGQSPREWARPAGDRGLGLLAYALALAVLIGLGVATVAVQVRSVRAGYRVRELEAERERLTEVRRRLELARVRESRLDALEKRAQRLGIELTVTPATPGAVAPAEVASRP